METFFQKHKARLGEKEALDVIINKAEKVKKYYNKGDDYEQCLRELSEMIDDFFAAKAG